MSDLNCKVFLASPYHGDLSGMVNSWLRNSQAGFFVEIISMTQSAFGKDNGMVALTIIYKEEKKA